MQCVFHSIRFKVNKKIGCLGEIAFFMEYDKEICSAPLYIIFFRIFARNLLKTNQIYAYET